MLKDKTTGELAARLVEIATGEPWGDGLTVTDVIVGCAEPGYSMADDAVIVLGIGPITTLRRFRPAMDWQCG